MKEYSKIATKAELSTFAKKAKKRTESFVAKVTKAAEKAAKRSKM